MGRKKVSPVKIWDEATSQLEVWDVVYTMFLGDIGDHPETSEMATLIKETPSIVPRL